MVAPRVQQAQPQATAEPQQQPLPRPAATDRRKPPPKAETAVGKGFFNRPKKPAKREQDSVAPVLAKSAEPGAADASAPKRPREGPSGGDGDVGEAALRVAHQTIAKDQHEGVAAFHDCRYREARVCFERMRDAARGAGLGKEEGQAYRLLGNVLDKLGAPDAEVEEAYKMALRMAHKEDDMELSFNTLTGMGSHAAKSGDLDVAEHFYLQAHTLARRVLTPREEGIAESNLGMCLAMTEARRSDSFEHFRKAIALQKDTSSQHSVAVLHANFASALSAHGDDRAAEGEYDKALAVARLAGDRRVETNVLINLANLYDGSLACPDKARRCRQELTRLRADAGGRFGGLEGGVSDCTEAQLCAVCLEPLESTSADGIARPVTTLPCRHAYHSSCWAGVVDSEVGDEARCPECRQGLTYAILRSEKS